MSAEYPDDLLYTREHEWARVDGTRAVIGITRFAVEQLGDITLVDLPAEGTLVTKGQRFGTIESVKSVSDLYAPLSGKVVRVNAALRDAPELTNSDCYGAAWMIEIEPSDRAELDDLLATDAYAALLA